VAYCGTIIVQSFAFNEGASLMRDKVMSHKNFSRMLRNFKKIKRLTAMTTKRKAKSSNNENDAQRTN